MDKIRPGRIVLVSGPSGVGKGTVIARIKQYSQLREDPLWESISDTTREPRGDELDGVEYNFISRGVFLARDAAGYYLETAVYANNLYGTPKLPILERSQAGLPVLAELEVQGATQILADADDELHSRLTLVFLAPPSLGQLRKQLIGRATESPKKIERRMAAAEWEMERSSMYDVIIVNHDVARSARLLERLLL